MKSSWPLILFIFGICMIGGGGAYLATSGLSFYELLSLCFIVSGFIGVIVSFRRFNGSRQKNGSFENRRGILEIPSMEHQLNQSREHLDFALKSAGMGTWDIDLSTDVLSCSQEMLDIWELTPEEFNGNRGALQTKVHSDDRQAMVVAIDHAIQNHDIYEFEFRIQPSPGVEKWIVSRGRCLYDPTSQHAVRFAGVVYDITKVKITEHELRRTKLLAEEANAAKTFFLANVSHELKTPMSAILGFFDLIKRGNLSPENHSKYSSIIEKNADNLLRLIDDLLNLTKIELGQVNIEKSIIELTSFLNDFAEVMKFKAADKGLDFELRSDGLIPQHIFTDPLRLKQILSNIVGNALKFTEKGGVKVIVYYEPNGTLCFDVTDSGPGIIEQDWIKLFQPFGQLDSSYTRKHGGSGLGLVLSKHLANNLGGDVCIKESVVGKGSKFAVTIPILEKNSNLIEFIDILRSKEESDSANSKAYPLEGMTILLVEDFSDLRELVQYYLSDSGARVETAVDGIDGTKKALAINPDVVLMDIQMPNLDGLSATKKLRNAGFSKPIIAVSAHALNDDDDRFYEKAGFSGFMTKPYEIDKLIKILSGYVT